jgi:hypothetical protein
VELPELPAPLNSFVYLKKDTAIYLKNYNPWMLELTLKGLENLNKVVANGCLEKKVLSYKFKTLERDPEPSIKTSKEAWELYTKNAPYELDIRFYYKRASKTVGYTYFYKDNVKSLGSETRIWSNTKFISGDPKDAAAHWGHELSHQERAGGFGHWTRFDGSFPYVVGELIGECLR